MDINIYHKEQKQQSQNSVSCQNSFCLEANVKTVTFIKLPLHVTKKKVITYSVMLLLTFSILSVDILNIKTTNE